MTEIPIFTPAGDEHQKALTPEGGIDGTGVVVVRNFIGAPGQRWITEVLNDGTFHIVHAPSGRVLDVAGASQNKGAEVLCWPRHGGPNQRFRIIDNNIIAVHSGQYLQVRGTAPHYNADGEIVHWPEPALDETPLEQWDNSNPGRRTFRVFSGPILSADTWKVMDVTQASMDDGERVIIWGRTGGANQSFQIERVPPTGLYRIIASHSGKVLDVEGASMEKGAHVIQWSWHGGMNQLFAIGPSPHESGGYLIRAAHSNRCLRLASASNTAGNQIVQGADFDQAYQTWLF
ncbi:RICIN domain-containing protein [Embleya sp. NPDC001921]